MFFFMPVCALHLVAFPSWYRSSSPCKLSCSESQRTLLSVELRILSCFKMPSLLKALPLLPHAIFLALSYVFLPVFPEFPSGNFLIFPTVSSSFLGFPRFPSRQWFLHSFPPFSSISPSFSRLSPWFFTTSFTKLPGGTCP